MSTVLVVDDDTQIAQILADMFEAAGFKTHAATSAEQAMHYIHADPGIVLMVTDVRMPCVSGIRLAEMALAERPTLPILLMSGYPGGTGETPPGWPFIRKPFRFADMLAMVRRLITPPTK